MILYTFIAKTWFVFRMLIFVLVAKWIYGLSSELDAQPTVPSTVLELPLKERNESEMRRSHVKIVRISDAPAFHGDSMQINRGGRGAARSVVLNFADGRRRSNGAPALEFDRTRSKVALG